MILQVINYVHSNLVLDHFSKENSVKTVFKLSIFLVFIFTSSVFAADIKIGYVDVEKLLKEAPQVEKINEKMLERFGTKKTELESAEKKIMELQEKYKRNELVMTDDKLNELKSVIISNVQMFKQSEAVLQQEVATMRNQEVAVLQQSIRGVIDEIAKNDKYDLIVSDGVLHSNKKLNITQQVLDKMSKLLKK